MIRQTTHRTQSPITTLTSTIKLPFTETSNNSEMTEWTTSRSTNQTLYPLWLVMDCEHNREKNCQVRKVNELFTQGNSEYITCVLK